MKTQIDRNFYNDFHHSFLKWSINFFNIMNFQNLAKKFKQFEWVEWVLKQFEWKFYMVHPHSFYL